MDRGSALMEYTAVIVMATALIAATVPVDRLPRELSAAVHRILSTGPEDRNPNGGRATTGHSEGNGTLDPARAADAVLRCSQGLPTPDPLGKVDCALSLLGLLDSDVLEATILRLDMDDLQELFASETFSATPAARVAVRLLWENASLATLHLLSRTGTFGFLGPMLESPALDWALVLVNAGEGRMRATIERNVASPRRTRRTQNTPIPVRDGPRRPPVPRPLTPSAPVPPAVVLLSGGAAARRAAESRSRPCRYPRFPTPHPRTSSPNPVGNRVWRPSSCSCWPPSR